MLRGRLSALLLSIAAGVAPLVACGTSEDATVASKLPDGVRERLAEGTPQDLIVVLRDDVAVSPKAMLSDAEREALISTRKDAYRVAREELVAGLPAGATVIGNLQHLPFVTVHVSTLDALDALVAEDAAIEIRVDEPRALAKGASKQLADLMTQLRDAPQRGAVAVIDSGVDFAQPAFGTCPEAGAPGCAVRFAADIAKDDGARDDDGHGTDVATSLVSEVAGVTVVSLDVTTDGITHDSDVLAALDWVIEHHSEYQISAISLALDDDAIAADGVIDRAAQLAASEHIGSAVALTNRMKNGGLHWQGGDRLTPQSTPTSLSVSINAGAVYTKTTAVTLTLAATGDTQMCISNTSTCTAWQTSTATKAWVLVAGSGTKTVYAFFRDAGGLVAGPTTDTIILDTTLPTDPSLSGVPGFAAPTPATSASLSLTGLTATHWTGVVGARTAGAAGNSQTLALVASDITEMTENGTDTVLFFIPGVTTVGTLESLMGLNSTLQMTTAGSAVTVLQVGDAFVATNLAGGADTIAGIRVNHLAWVGAADATSGIQSFVLFGSSTATPTSCTGNGPLMTGTQTTFDDSAVTIGTRFYRLCVKDNAGNFSTGATATVRTATQYGTPLVTGSTLTTGVVIAGGAEYTKLLTVPVALFGRDQASSPAAPAKMCVNNTSTICATFENYATTKNLTLSTVAGLKTVYVWFRDAEGNTTAAPWTDTIIYDAVVPVNGKVGVNNATSGRVTVLWSGFTDANSPVDGYKVVRATGSTAPTASCTGTDLNAGTPNAVSYTDTTTVASTVYTYRVCAIDRAGNVSTGTTTTVTAH